MSRPPLPPFTRETAAQKARISILAGSTSYFSEYHSGSSTDNGDFFTLIAGPTTGLASVTRLQLLMEGSGSAYFQCAGFYLLPLSLPPMYVGAPMRLRAHRFARIATPAVANDYDAFRPIRPILVVGAQPVCRTAPTTDAVIVDLKTPISGTYQSLFTTLPQIAAGKLTGTLQACDPAAADYRRRIIRGLYTAADTTMPDNSEIRLDVTQRDTGTTCANVDVVMFYLEYERPFDQYRALSDLGEA